jgi:hypothetical protein
MASLQKASFKLKKFAKQESSTNQKVKKFFLIGDILKQ